MKALVAAFNQEKALVGAFSVIVKTDCGTNGSFYSTNQDPEHGKVAVVDSAGTTILAPATNILSSDHNLV